MSKAKDDFLDVLEKGVRDVLSSQESTAGEKIQAIAAGSKLLQIKHKLGNLDDNGKPGSFFKQ